MTKQNSEKSRKRYKSVVSVIGILIFASIFVGPKYSLVSFLPAFMGGACAFYIFRYETLSDSAIAALIGLVQVFGVREYGSMNHRYGENRLLTKIEKACNNSDARDSIACEDILNNIWSFRNAELDDG